jgi:hypothetical protein
MKIVNLEEINEWQEGNLFTSRNWLEVLSACYGFKFKAVADDDGRPRMFFCIIEDIFGKRIISLPFSDYTELDPLSGEEVACLTWAIREAFPGMPVTVKLLGEHDLTAEGFNRSRSAVCHRIPLAGKMDHIWQRTSHAFRKGVAKAERSGLTFEVSNDQDSLNAFYALLVELRKRKYRILPQSREFYALLLNIFSAEGAGYLCTVRKEGRVLAAAMVLRSGGMLFDKMGVSDMEFQDLRPNNLLLWEVMKLGNAIGASHLDMGLTQADHEGLLAFKDSLGGERMPVFYHRHNPVGFDLSREQATKEMLKQVTEHLVDANLDHQRLSLAGTLLYKYFC